MGDIPPVILELFEKIQPKILEKANEILIPPECPRLECDPISDCINNISEDLKAILNDEKCLKALINNLTESKIREFIQDVYDIIENVRIQMLIDMGAPAEQITEQYILKDLSFGTAGFVQLLLSIYLSLSVSIIEIFNMQSDIRIDGLESKLDIDLISLIIRKIPTAYNYFANAINEIFKLPTCNYFKGVKSAVSDNLLIPEGGCLNEDCMTRFCTDFNLMKIPTINPGLVKLAEDIPDIEKIINTLKIVGGLVLGVMLLVIIILSIVIAVKNKKLKN